jgi:hypothetical protein
MYKPVIKNRVYMYIPTYEMNNESILSSNQRSYEACNRSLAQKFQGNRKPLFSVLSANSMETEIGHLQLFSTCHSEQ